MLCTFDVRMFDPVNDIVLLESHGYDGIMHHQHSFIELTYITSGTGLNTTEETETELEVGDVLFINQNVWHSLSPTCEDSQFRWINCIFTPESLGIPFHLFNGEELFRYGKDEKMLAFFHQLKAEYDGKHIYSQEILKGRLYAFLYELLRTLHHGSAKQDKKQMTSIRYRQYVDKAVGYIVQNYASPIKLADIANHVGISKSHLDRVFCAEVQTTPIDVLNNYRVEQACKILINTNQPLSEVAQTVGIGDNKFFYTLFKRRMGTTPGEYRQRNQRLSQRIIRNKEAVV